MLDIVGTGGDGADTFNISTASCILAAACGNVKSAIRAFVTSFRAGCRVAKCGNRASSSSCGSADVIESLGVPLVLSPDQVVSSITSCGLGFLFAPVFHPAAKGFSFLISGSTFHYMNNCALSCGADPQSTGGQNLLQSAGPSSQLRNREPSGKEFPIEMLSNIS